MKTTENAVLLKNSIWKVVDIDHHVVLIDAAFQQRINLNDSATVIWRLIDGVRSCGEIHELLVDAYGSDEVNAEDIFGVFDYLTANQLALEVL